MSKLVADIYFRFWVQMVPLILVWIIIYLINIIQQVPLIELNLEQERLCAEVCEHAVISF